MLPYDVIDLLRGGYRSRKIYDEYQFGAVGEEERKKTNEGAVPYDLWQAGM